MLHVFAGAKKPHVLHSATLMLTNRAASESNNIKSRSQQGPDSIQPPRSFCASPTQANEQISKDLIAPYGFGWISQLSATKRPGSSTAGTT